MDPFCLYVASLAFNLLPAPPNHLEEKCQRSQYIRQITLDDEDNDSERLIALKIRQRDVDDECCEFNRVCARREEIEESFLPASVGPEASS